MKLIKEGFSPKVIRGLFLPNGRVLSRNLGMEK
jgi:hypothetical protein